MDRTDNDSKWEFDMPQFWDFTDSIPQKRPDERWFCQANISGPSFPERKKRRALRVHKKPAAESQMAAEKPPVSEKPTSNVFDRLSRLSTISFANKTQHSSNEKEKRPLKQHVFPPKSQQHTAYVSTQEHEQYQLDEDMLKESVAERISRIEKDIFSKKDIPLKRKISSSAPLQQKKMQKTISVQHGTEHTYLHRPPSPTGESSSISAKLHSGYPSTEERPSQPIKEQPSLPVSNRISLLNELQNSRWPSPTQSKQALESPAAEEREDEIPYQIPLDLIPVVSTRRSLYAELEDSQRQSPSYQSKEMHLSPYHHPQPPPVSSIAEAQENKENEDTSTHDFFNDLLKSKQQRNDLQKETTSNFFTDLLTSNKQRYQNRPLRSSVNENRDKKEATHEEEKEATTQDFFDNLLVSTKQRNNNRAPLSPINDEQTTTNNLLSNSQETNQEGNESHRYESSLIPDEIQQQNAERQAVPSRLTQVDSQANPARPTQTHRETLLAIPPGGIPSTSIQVYRDEPATMQIRKNYYSLDDPHLVDETVQRARKLLKASRERTQKWLKELSVNQPLRASQNIEKLKK
ncbi:hypothetical protein BD408DRAFT_442414 [Parasitella parasitica]|nr:hypothetical protein BD408DRAFT_442414 [Parasitella parasitica]